MSKKVITVIKVLVLLDLLTFFVSFLFQCVFRVLGPLTPIVLIGLGIWGWRKLKVSRRDKAK